MVGRGLAIHQPSHPFEPHPLRALTPHPLPPITSLPAAVIRSVNRQDECVQPSLHQIDILILSINEPTVCFRLQTNECFTY